jgi:hypothetical protein
MPYMHDYVSEEDVIEEDDGDEIIGGVLELYIEEQKKKITELTEEVILSRTRITYLEKQLNESPVPVKMKKRLVDIKAENNTKDNEVHALKIEVYELRKLVPEGILINRDNKIKPVRKGQQLR